MIRFAIVGFGNIGNKHAKIISENKDCRLVALCDIDLRTKKNNIYNSPFYTTIEDLVRNEAFDILVICTPNYLHISHAIFGIKNGLDVLVEKPVGLKYDECVELEKVQNETGKSVYTIMQNRFNPAVQFAHQLLKEAALGKILHAQINCFWNRNELYYKDSSWHGSKEKDGGILYTQFSHFIDAALFLFGPMKPLFGKISNVNHPYIEIEDNGNFILELQDHQLVNFNYSINSFAKNMEGSITIFGEKGTIKIGGKYLNKIDFCTIEKNVEENISLINAQPTINNKYNGYEGSISNHDKVYQSLVGNYLHQSPYYTTLADGIKVVNLIEKMYKLAST